VFNFRDNGLKFAFGAEGFIDRTLKDDPRYVKTFARLYGHREGKLFEQLIPMHYCTEQDLEDFDEPTSESQGVFRSFKQDPDRKLFCLDWEKYGDILEIWGTENDEVNYQRFEYVVVPCNYVHAEI